MPITFDPNNNSFVVTPNPASPVPSIPTPTDEINPTQLQTLFSTIRNNSQDVPLLAFVGFVQAGIEKLKEQQYLDIDQNFLDAAGYSSDVATQFQDIIAETSPLPAQFSGLLSVVGAMQTSQGDVSSDSSQLGPLLTLLNLEQGTLANDAGTYNAELLNMQTQFPIDAANYEASPTPENLGVLTADYANYNAAVATLIQDVSNYNTDLQNAENLTKQYNGDLSSFDSNISAYNTLITQFNNTPGLGPFPLYPTTTIAPLSLPSSVTAPSPLTEVFSPPFPDLSTTPIFAPPQEVLPNPPLVPSAPNDPTDPNSTMTLTSASFFANWTQASDQAQTTLQLVDDLSEELDPALVDFAASLTNANVSELPSSFSSSYSVSTAAAVSAALSILTIGLGSPTLATALSSLLIDQAAGGRFDNANLTNAQISAGLSALVALSPYEIIWNRSIFDVGNIESPGATSYLGTLTSNQIVNQVASGNLENTILNALQSNASFNALSSADQAQIVDNILNGASTILGTASLYLAANTTQDVNGVLQAGAFSFYSSLSPALLSEDALSTLNGTFNTQPLIQSTVETVGNTAAFQNFLSSQVTQTNNQLSSNVAASLASAYVQNVQNQSNLNQAIVNVLAEANLTNTQSQAQAIIERLNNSVTGLLLTPNGPANQSVLGVNANLVLDAIAQYKNQNILNQLKWENLQVSYSNTGELQATVNGNELKAVQHLSDVAQNLATSQDQTYSESAVDAFNTFLNQSMLLDPTAFTTALLDPGKTFIGLMYEGDKTGFKRGSIDIQA